MRVEFLEAAGAEYCAAVDYYDEENPDLGGEFADEIALATAQRREGTD